MEDGFTIEYPDGGLDRPPWRVENEDEVLLAYQRRKRPRIVCDYCASRCPQTRDPESAVKWFHSHDCRTLEQAEAEALVLSLRAYPSITEKAA